MCFLEGWRKQIFLCFAGFLLVKNYGIDLKTMLMLWVIAQAIGYFAAPRIGRLIDRVGERPVLVFYYSTMIAIFAGYLAIPADWTLFTLPCGWLSPLLPEAWRQCVPPQLHIGGLHILCTLFVADSVFFAFNAALTTYVNKIAPPAEHTATLSMGVAMNHVAAVTMPLVGGLLWQHLGYQYAFMMGAVAAIASVIVSTFVPAHNR
jgi:MFS family permease